MTTIWTDSDAEARALATAVDAATRAAHAIDGLEQWLLHAELARVHLPLLNAELATPLTTAHHALVTFAAETPTAPAEALFIKSKALGLVDASDAWDTMPELTRTAWHTYHQVLGVVHGQFSAAERERQAREAAEQAARAQSRPLTEEDLRDTPFEKVPHPLEPLVARPKPGKAKPANAKKAGKVRA